MTVAGIRPKVFSLLPVGSKKSSATGHEVFYRSESGGFVAAVPVSTGSDVKVGAPVRLTQQRYVIGPFSYDVSADGQRVLMIKDRAIERVETGSERIILIENWFEELKQKMGTPQR